MIALALPTQNCVHAEGSGRDTLATSLGDDELDFEREVQYTTRRRNQHE
jgi:hypothetical protein